MRGARYDAYLQPVNQRERTTLANLWDCAGNATNRNGSGGWRRSWPFPFPRPPVVAGAPPESRTSLIPVAASVLKLQSDLVISFD